DEFYSVAFRKKLYSSLEQLQDDLDTWLEEYNQRRPHSGKYCFGKTPVQTFLDSRRLAHDKQLDRFPVVSSADSRSRALRAASVSYNLVRSSLNYYKLRNEFALSRMSGVGRFWTLGVDSLIKKRSLLARQS